MADVNLNIDKAAASTVSEVVFETPLNVAVIVAVTVAATGFVVTGETTEALPASTLAEGETSTLALFEEMATTSPPEPALPLKVTVT